MYTAPRETGAQLRSGAAMEIRYLRDASNQMAGRSIEQDGIDLDGLPEADRVGDAIESIQRLVVAR